MFKGLKNFLLQGELVVVAVGLVVALAFSTLVKSFTDAVITPLVNAAEGGTTSPGLGWTLHGQFINVGAFISAVVYFVIFIAVVYFALVVPYRAYMKKHGTEVFAPPAAAPAVKSCPECLSSDLPEAARKCRYCASVLP